MTKKTILTFNLLLLCSIAFSQGTQVAGSPVYHSSNNVHIGGNTNAGLYVRHLYGKEALSTLADILYLNYNTGKNVWVGGFTGTTSNLLVDGKVGIGTSGPTAKLEVSGGNIAGNSAVIAQGNNYTWTNGATFIDYNPSAGYGRIGAYDYSTASWKNLTIGGGNLGIGTPNPSEKLEVNGNARIVGEIYSKKVKVSANASNWPDYVFEPDYQLRTLAETEVFIKANKHLPEVPSAKEIEEKGQDLGDVQTILLKKIEEMTLQMIEMNKRLEKLEKENKALKENEE